MNYASPEQWMVENDDNGDPDPYPYRPAEDDEPDCGSCSCTVFCEGRP